MATNLVPVFNVLSLILTRKGFSEKNNNCVYKLHNIHTRLIYTKPVWAHVLALGVWTLKKAHYSLFP